MRKNDIRRFGRPQLNCIAAAPVDLRRAPLGRQGSPPPRTGLWLLWKRDDDRKDVNPPPFLPGRSLAFDDEDAITAHCRRRANSFLPGINGKSMIQNTLTKVVQLGNSVYSTK